MTNHMAYEKRQERERARRHKIPEGQCVWFDEAYERGMLLQQLDLSKVDVNMFGAANNSLINDGCGLFRGDRSCLTSICPGSRAIRLINKRTLTESEGSFVYKKLYASISPIARTISAFPASTAVQRLISVSGLPPRRTSVSSELTV